MILLIKFVLDSLILFLEIQELFKSSLVLCVCVFFLDKYLCDVCWHGTCGNQKRVLEPLELGLQTVVSTVWFWKYGLGPLLRATY